MRKNIMIGLCFIVRVIILAIFWHEYFAAIFRANNWYSFFITVIIFLLAKYTLDSFIVEYRNFAYNNEQFWENKKQTLCKD